MKIHFKMLINDGEKYYISDNPGIALCDYVYMRGLESIDDNRFWEEQLAHYQAHKAFNFDLDLVASSSIAKVLNNKKYLMECWNKLTDGLRVDLNAYFGTTPLNL